MNRPGGWWVKLSREPLLLFLVIGALLFTTNQLVAASMDLDDSPQRITVERGDLLRFLQYRSKVFNEEGVSRHFDALSAAERQELIDSYVREEALYREALTWRLDKEDYVVRRRLVQSLEFALEDEPVATSRVLDEAVLRRFYVANPRLYSLSPSISFTHVFFRHGPDAAARARSALLAIRAGTISSANAGDRFLYSANYAEQSRDSIARDFGGAFAANLWRDPEPRGWVGPVRSDHGIHLVKVLKFDGGGVPPFEAVRSKVATDTAEALRRERQQAAVQGIIERYRVTIASGLR